MLSETTAVLAVSTEGKCYIRSGASGPCQAMVKPDPLFPQTPRAGLSLHRALCPRCEKREQLRAGEGLASLFHLPDLVMGQALGI